MEQEMAELASALSDVDLRVLRQVVCPEVWSSVLTADEREQLAVYLPLTPASTPDLQTIGRLARGGGESFHFVQPLQRFINHLRDGILDEFGKLRRAEVLRLEQDAHRESVIAYHNAMVDSLHQLPKMWLPTAPRPTVHLLPPAQLSKPPPAKRVRKSASGGFSALLPVPPAAFGDGGLAADPGRRQPSAAGAAGDDDDEGEGDDEGEVLYLGGAALGAPAPTAAAAAVLDPALASARSFFELIRATVCQAPNRIAPTEYLCRQVAKRMELLGPELTATWVPEGVTLRDYLLSALKFLVAPAPTDAPTPSGLACPLPGCPAPLVAFDVSTQAYTWLGYRPGPAPAAAQSELGAQPAPTASEAAAAGGEGGAGSGDEEGSEAEGEGGQARRPSPAPAPSAPLSPEEMELRLVAYLDEWHCAAHQQALSSGNPISSGRFGQAQSVAGFVMRGVPNRTGVSVARTSPAAVLKFREQEAQRYLHPDKPYIFTFSSRDSTGAERTFDTAVAPIKRGVANPLTKPREHALLKSERPSHVTILTLVRDAAARLIDGVGTRADVSELLRDSAYVFEGASEAQLSQVVSGALDRLHYEADACVKYEAERKLWIYLHRSRTLGQFGQAAAGNTRKSQTERKRPAPSSQHALGGGSSGGPRAPPGAGPSASSLLKLPGLGFAPPGSRPPPGFSATRS